MLGVVIVLLSGAVVAFSAVAGLHLSMVAAAGVLSVYATLLLSDLLQFVSGADRAVPAAEDLITSPVRALRTRLHGLVMRAEAFEWQGEQVRSLSAGVRRDPLFRELVTSGNWRSGGVNALAGQVVRYLRSRSRAAAMAAYLWDEQSSATGLLGVDGERFTALLERQGELVKRGAPLPDESALFAQFGFASALVRAAKLDEQTGLLVWIGYPDQIAVTPAEQRLLAELVEALSDEMQYSRELAKLTKAGAVATAPQKAPMLAQFSHDIRSPLSNVKAILSLLRLEELRSETVQLVEVALSNCRGVEAVVEDVIDLSRFQAGKLQRREDEVLLEPLIAEVVEGFVVTARMRGLALSTRFPKERLAIRGDKNQLRRMITNLVSNAIKYTQFGSVTVSLSRNAAGEPEIAVTDTGVGMSEEQLAKLFEPFTRFQGTEIEGAGLGLSIVKMMAEQHGGSIDVRSTPGQGSVFTLRFAALPPGADGPHDDGDDADDELLPAAVKRRILVVDDDVDVVQSMAKLLTRQGHEVMQAVTVHDALSIINFDSPDLIITDTSMPGGGGRRLLQFVTDGGRDIPVVFLSGDTSKEQELKALGAVAVLEKPCEFEELCAVVAAVTAPRAKLAQA